MDQKQRDSAAELDANRFGGTGEGDQSRSVDVVRRFVELLALTSFAIAQPVLDAFGRAPEHFVFHGAGRSEIILFALLVALVPPLCLAAAGAVVAMASDRFGRIVHVGLLATLGGLAGIQLGWQVLDLKSAALLAFGVLIGLVVGALYLRTQVFPGSVRYASVLSVLAVVTFLFTSPVADLVWSQTTDAATVDFADTPPIVVVIFDELPTATLMGADGTIDAALFPNFARLGEVATWYRNNSTNSNTTVLAVPALLTGRIPDRMEATLANHPNNIFTLLGGAYTVRADEAPIHMCPENLCEGVATSGGGFDQLLADGWRLWRDLVSINEPGGAVFDLLEETVALDTENKAQPLASQEKLAAAFQEAERLMTTSPARLLGFLEAIVPSDRPTLNYLHLQIPHGPFRFYANGAHYYPKNGGAEASNRYGLRGDSEEPAKVDRQRHILQTQYADALIGQILDRLESQGLLDESIVIVASDHGIAFNPNVTSRLSSEETLLFDSVDDVFWAPLFMKAAGQGGGGISDAPTQLIDVLPTLIDWLGADPGWTLDGLPVDQVANRTERTLCRPLYEEGAATSSTCVQFPVTDEMLAELRASSVGRFLPAEDSDFRVYQVGTFGGLVGSPVSDMDEGGARSRELTLRDLAGLAGLDSDGRLRGLVTGALASGDDGVVVALAVNGTVAAVMESHTVGDKQGLVRAILPYPLLNAGDNEIAAYVVEGSAAEPTLHSIELIGGYFPDRHSRSVTGIVTLKR